LAQGRFVGLWVRPAPPLLWRFDDWREQIEKVIADVFLIISLVLGTGVSVRALHSEARKLAVEAILKEQSSLSAFSQKLTRRK
jgi:hypothetical protein